MTQRILAIESATDWLSIALLEDDQVVLCREASETRQHASELMPLIAAGLGDCDWSIGSLDALAVSAGPGSFTSLRIGLATAKGLALGRDWPAVGVSTLEVMAASVLDGASDASVSSSVVALLDARRGEWYAGGWRADAGASDSREVVLTEGLYQPAALSREISGPLVLVCPERTGWQAEFGALGLSLAKCVEGEAARPRADWVGRLGFAQLAAGQGEPADALAARYLRRAEAEAKRLGEPVEAGEVARLESPD